jgi:NADPH:quinone reductase
MRAIEISSFGPPGVLQCVERPQPQPARDEVVIRVAAAGVARADLLQRQGKYAPPPGASTIPGLDIAGVIHAVGADALHLWQPGDRVCAILTGGGYAEYCAVPASQVLPIPEGWTGIEAATLPENLFTVYDNLITRAALQAGETVLIHGGSSGIGTLAIMLARAWGAIPIATAGSSRKCSACLAHGAQKAINYKEADFVSEAGPVDVILDMLGGSYLDRNLNALAPEGRLVIIAVSGGATAQLDIAKLLHKRARVIGSTMRARSVAAKAQVARNLLRDVWPLLPAKTTIRPVLDSTFPLTEASRAHAHMEAGENIGKIVLVVNGRDE